MPSDFKFSHAFRGDLNTRSLSCLSLFPWGGTPSVRLWNGKFVDHEWGRSKWANICRQFSSYLAVGGTDGIHIYDVAAVGAPSLVLQVRPPSQMKRANESDDKIRCITWAISAKRPHDPLLVFAVSRVIHVLDVQTQQFIGSMRGHGGTIMSLSANPMWPNLVLSTSRDHTSRLWDMSERPTLAPTNPIWPGLPPPTLAGAPHGLQASENEGAGDGAGACVALLMGGSSGGHQAAVLAAAWHPEGLPVVATCGTDRCVKIWRIPDLEPDARFLVTEDKPMFSSDDIHAARVISIAWIAKDILITQSASTLMKLNTARERWEKAPGTVCVWKWLSFDLYMPGGTLFPTSESARGPQADYNGSSSFHILSEAKLPMDTTDVHVYTGPYATSFTLVAAKNNRELYHVRICDLPRPVAPPPPPPLPYAERSDDRDISSLDTIKMTRQLRIPDRVGTPRALTVSSSGRIMMTVGDEGHISMWRR